MVRLQCHDGYLFSDHIPGSPWSILGHMMWCLRSTTVKWWDFWQNDECFLCTLLRLIRAQVLDWAVYTCQRSLFEKCWHHYEPRVLCMHIFLLTVPVRMEDGDMMEDFQPFCEVQLVALSLPLRFCPGAQEFYFGLGFLHQLMAVGLKRHHCLPWKPADEGFWIKNRPRCQWEKPFALAIKACKASGLDHFFFTWHKIMVELGTSGV